MASWAQSIIGYLSGVGADVDANNRILVNLAGTAAPAEVGAVRFMSENDADTNLLSSPETDSDCRLRVAHENLLDSEIFNYTAQNTGKHLYRTTTATITWTTSGLLTNATGITTTTTGVAFQSYAEFPLFPSADVYNEFIFSFSAQPVSNTIIDFGLARLGAANPYAPTDGVFFRLTSAGLFGVVNYSTVETTVALMNGAVPFAYTNGSKHQGIIAATETEVQFWIDGKLWGSIPNPAGQGQPAMSATLPVGIRHAIVGGAAGGVIQATVNSYTVSVGGPIFAGPLSIAGSRVLGAYQGLSGGTMGSLANYANNTNPAPAVPTNTTAALGSGLGGQFWETDTLAVNTDGIIQSYQVPAGTVSVQGKRLVVRGVKIESFVQTTLTGGGYNGVFTLNVGGSAVSLATAEAAAAKARRVIPLGNQVVAAAAAALTKLDTVFLDLGDAPVFVNPGEFVQVAKKKVGTAPSAGTIVHTVTFIYGWE